MSNFSTEWGAYPQLDLAAEHGHHVPGTPYTYKHGWVPLAAVAKPKIVTYPTTQDLDAAPDGSELKFVGKTYRKSKGFWVEPNNPDAMLYSSGELNGALGALYYPSKSAEKQEPAGHVKLMGETVSGVEDLKALPPGAKLTSHGSGAIVKMPDGNFALAKADGTPLASYKAGLKKITPETLAAHTKSFEFQTVVSIDKVMPKPKVEKVKPKESLTIGSTYDYEKIANLPAGSEVQYASPYGGPVPNAIWVSNGDGSFYLPSAGDEPGEQHYPQKTPGLAVPSQWVYIGPGKTEPPTKTLDKPSEAELQVAPIGSELGFGFGENNVYVKVSSNEWQIKDKLTGKTDINSQIYYSGDLADYGTLTYPSGVDTEPHGKLSMTTLNALPIGTRLQNDVQAQSGDYFEQTEAGLWKEFNKYGGLHGGSWFNHDLFDLQEAPSGGPLKVVNTSEPKTIQMGPTKVVKLDTGHPGSAYNQIMSSPEGSTLQYESQKDEGWYYKQLGTGEWQVTKPNGEPGTLPKTTTNSLIQTEGQPLYLHYGGPPGKKPLFSTQAEVTGVKDTGYQLGDEILSPAALDSLPIGSKVHPAGTMPGADYEKQAGGWVALYSTQGHPTQSASEVLGVKGSVEVTSLPGVEKVSTTNIPEGFKPRAEVLGDEETFLARPTAASVKEALPKSPNFDEYAVTSYTGSWAGEINGTLRSGDVPYYDHDKVDKLDGSMSPLTSDTIFYRGVPPIAFGLGGTGTFIENPGETAAKLKALIGQTITDKGYMSTSHRADAGPINSAPIVIKILAPKGTKAVFAELVSSFQEEHEVIMHRGMQLKVKDVVSTISASGKKQFVVVGEVVSVQEPGGKK